MAPKIGPRGITIQNVRDVATRGLPQTGSATYRSTYEPAPPVTSTIDYAALLAGGPASTYGEKYAGMPSAEYAKNLIIGGAQQARSVGELAALKAATAGETLGSKLAQDLLSGTQRQLPINRELFARPISTPTSARDIGITNIARRIPEIEQQLTELDFEKYPLGSSRRREGLRTQDILQANLADYNRFGKLINPTGRTPEEIDAENKAAAYGNYMTRMNLLDLSQPGVSVDRTNISSTQNVGGQQPNIPSLLRAGAERQVLGELTPGFEKSFEQQVRPYQNVAEGILDIPLSEYARQIAVQRYGYDPALAQGIFDTGIDVQSLKDEADLFAAQHPELNMNPAETVFYLRGQEGLDQYLAQQAEESLYGTPTQQATAEEQALAAQNEPVDMDLYNVYASTPTELNSAPPEVARAVMSDPNFLSFFQIGIEEIKTAVDAGANGADAINEYVSNYLTETANPPSARILEELLANVTFG